MQFQFISDKSIGNFNLHRRSLSIFYDFFGSRPACKISTPSHTHAKCQDMPNFFLDLGIGYPTFNIYFFFGTQQAKIQKNSENRRKYSRSGVHCCPQGLQSKWIVKGFLYFASPFGKIPLQLEIISKWYTFGLFLVISSYVLPTKITKIDIPMLCHYNST